MNIHFWNECFLAVEGFPNGPPNIPNLPRGMRMGQFSMLSPNLRKVESGKVKGPNNLQEVLARSGTNNLIETSADFPWGSSLGDPDGILGGLLGILPSS